MHDEDLDVYAVAAVQSKALVLRGSRQLQAEEIPLEHFGPLHVQVRVRSIGLSSPDLANYQRAPQSGLVLGKEASGQIVAVGTHIAKTWPHLQIGHRVVLEPSIPCRVCNECSIGRYNVCPNVRTAGTAITKPYVHGFMRKLVNWPGEMIHVLPANVPYDLAILAQPLATVIHGFKRANLQPSSSVTIIGAGLLGLLSCAYARSLNCFPISLVDADEGRLQLAAEQNWASHQYKIPSALPPHASTPDEIVVFNRSIAEAVLQNTQQLAGFEALVETTGTERGAQLSIFLGARAGKIMLLNGAESSAQYVPLQYAVTNEIDIVSVHGHANSFPTALSCMASGTLGNLRALLTQKVAFDKADAGFRYMLASRDAEDRPVVKVLVEGETSARR